MDGDDCATVCPAPNSGAGTIAIVTDMPTYNSQLMTTVTASVTVTGSEGFSGLVALTAAITDSTGTAISEWPVSFDNAMVSVPMNGTATAKATIKIPSTAIPSSDTTTLSGTLQVTGTPMSTAVTAQSTTAALAIANTLEIDMSSDGTTCTFPAFVTAAAVQVAVGTTVNWKNTGTDAATDGFVIHVDGNTTLPGGTQGPANNSGISHQGEGAALPPSETGGTTNGTPNPLVWPELVTNVVSGTVTWHCHAPPDNGPTPGPSVSLS